MTPASFSELVDNITPEMHAQLQQAVQLGRFPDGRRLSREQQAELLRTILAWEAKQGLPEEERTGAMKQKNCGSAKGKEESKSGGLGVFQPNQP